MKVTAIVNSKGGSAVNDEELHEAFSKQNVEAEIISASGKALEESFKNTAAIPGIIAAGGGDGTISSAASHIVKTQNILAVLPLGTLNHFAKDLNLPLELDKAVKLIKKNQIDVVDTASINGNTFLNNCSFGAYPKMVKERKYAWLSKISKKISTITTSVKIFFKLPLINAHIIANKKSIHITTPLIFIGNNEYKMELFKFAERKSLTEGKLYVYYIISKNRLSIILLMFHAIFNRLKEARDFNFFSADEVEIKLQADCVTAAVDGELIKLKNPVKIAAHPKSLRVIVPYNVND